MHIEALIRDPVEKLLDLAALIEPLLMVRRLMRERLGSLEEKLSRFINIDIRVQRIGICFDRDACAYAPKPYSCGEFNLPLRWRESPAPREASLTKNPRRALQEKNTMTGITKFCALSSAVAILTLFNYIANAVEVPKVTTPTIKVTTPTIKVNPTTPKSGSFSSGGGGGSGKVFSSGGGGGSGK